MMPTVLQRLTAVVILLAVGSGCVGDEVVVPVAPVEGGTVPLGALPGQPSSMTLPPAPTAPSATVGSTVVPTIDPVSVPVGDAASGTRVLLIGDTALSRTTARATGDMCDALTDAGWDVSVEAERGRPVEFGDVVLDAILDSSTLVGEDWSVVGLMFGHHLSDDMVDSLDDSIADRFADALASLVDRLGNRPVLLYTVVEIDAEQDGVNDSIRAVAAGRPNVVVVDWATAVDEEPDLVVDGGLLPSDAGASTLAELTADVLGVVDDIESGECIESTFVDDSAIVL